MSLRLIKNNTKPNKLTGFFLVPKVDVVTNEEHVPSLGLRVHHQGDVAIDEREGEELDVLARRRLLFLFWTKEQKTKLIQSEY